ncbi:radical SAM/SPASM domain-containing protein [Parasphaerochaeta coccoides]|uniref:Radical SAM domain protein n=1 Tax=Parasphaerochaeta coccoides (strain ATCC BAA-1237 / DSM 17374 / SPN1) TaxID=760011 RepID=F4GLC1_PARC1|nr:SPASM domain-containing protein [Parasphaerochaeta coccoides]AEC02953.1 Radical SAM domain protein [Parasphaerochaeta coccoides DSM 17374]
MKPLSIMIKPASSACNLACDYCFYCNEAANRSVPCHTIMKEDVVRALLHKTLEEAGSVSYAFQGGEPALAGLSWFKRFVALEKELNTGHIPVSYAFQTNGTLMDDTWAAFFKENGFLVGISCDGAPRIHNMHRPRIGGGRSSADVLAGIEAMQRAHVDLNILTVVTDEVAQNIDQVWDFFMRHGLYYQQYIPCMNLLGDARDFLTAEAYGHFLIQLAQKWMHSLHSPFPVSIRYFDNLVGMYMGLPPEACDMKGVCSVQYVVESDGSTYPCDFYCLDPYLLGNILSDSLQTINDKRFTTLFLHNTRNGSEKCKECPYLMLCRGGCKRYRDEKGEYRFCESHRMFFREMNEPFMKLVSFLAKERGE